MELARRLRPIQKSEAIQSYKDLRAQGCEEAKRFSRLGLDCLDYFFLGHRLKAKTKKHVSFSSAVKDKELVDYLNEKIKKIRGKMPMLMNNDELLSHRYSVFQLYYGTINQFRPTEALRVYCTLKPKVGILDFSAGWGGRCLAAMAHGTPYIGVDANVNLAPAYKSMIQAVEPAADVQLFFQPSETIDFSRFAYDLVFTSPPYFMLEEYEKMPQYGSKEGFIEKFFRPVVKSAWTHLKSPGYMALNMPKEMYDAIKGDMPKLWKRMRLPITNRHPSNAAAGRAIGAKNVATRSEGIYVWKKGGTQTRKIKK